MLSNAVRQRDWGVSRFIAVQPENKQVCWLKIIFTVLLLVGAGF